MIKRPLPVTIIAWFLIISSGISISSFYFNLNHPNPVVAKLFHSRLPATVEHIITFISLLIDLVCGIAFLKGRNWGRGLYVITAILFFINSVVSHSMKPQMLLLSIITFIIFSGVIITFLYLPKSNQYFKGNSGEINWKPTRLLSILFYVLAGIYISVVIMFAFINLPLKFVSIGVITLLVGILLLIGMAFNRFRNIKLELGTIILSASIFSAVIIFVVIATLLFATKLTMDVPNLNIMKEQFNDYWTGFTTLVAFFLVGIVLVLSSKKAELTDNLPKQNTPNLHA